MTKVLRYIIDGLLQREAMYARKRLHVSLHTPVMGLPGCISHPESV